jgi:hypothetical protein
VETFVVRVFVAAVGEAVPLCGVVEHIGSGSRDAFENADRLIRLLELRLRPPRDLDRGKFETKGAMS